jgi:hypothetical protein
MFTFVNKMSFSADDRVNTLIPLWLLLSVEKRCALRLDRIGGDAVKRAIPTLSDGCSQGCEELFRVLDTGTGSRLGVAF